MIINPRCIKRHDNNARRSLRRHYVHNHSSRNHCHCRFIVMHSNDLSFRIDRSIYRLFPIKLRPMSGKQSRKNQRTDVSYCFSMNNTSIYLFFFCCLSSRYSEIVRSLFSRYFESFQFIFKRRNIKLRSSIT